MRQIIAILLFIGLSEGALAQCLSPSNYLANNITTNSIDIDLNASGNGPWEIEYGPVGFTIGSGVTISSSANMVSLTNLSPATAYRVFIRRQCGSQTSAWSSFTFSTSCGTVLNAPITFNFEGAVWQSPTNPTGTGNVGNCWIVSPLGTNTFWAAGPPHDTRLTTGPLGDHSTGFGTFIHLNGLGISQDSISNIQSPAINLQGLSDPKLKFWYHLYGAGIDSLEILCRTNNSIHWDTIHTFKGPTHFSQEEPWLERVLPLQSYIDSTIYLQFVGYGKGTDVQMAIDDLSFYDAIDCLAPSFFRNISNDENSVLLDWDAGSGSSQVLEYGPKGFTLGNGTQLLVGAPPYRVNNLSANTSYDFYLRDNCGSSQFSAWTAALEVNTDCTPITAPYSDDFEGAAWPNGALNTCWDRYEYLDFKWQIGPPSLNYVQSGPGPNNHTPGGSQFIVADRPNQKGNARSSLTTPLFDLDTISNPELIFWSHMFGLQITAFDIAVDSGDGFIQLKRIIGSQQLSKSAPWTEQIIELPGYGGKKVKFKFTAIASSNWSSLARIAIDDFYIGEAPPCRKPTDIQLDHLSFSEASISWLSGGATNWIVRLQTNGTSSTLSSTTSNPLFLNQLQPGTEYTIWVRDSCGPGLVSDWSAPLDFKTYCLPDSAPYFQDFESSPFQVQNSWFSTGTMHPCWERSHELGAIWQPSPASILPNNLLPAADHTTGSGKYIGGSLFLGNGTNEPTSFTSPHIDLSGLSRPELSFWYFLGGYSFSSNQIQVEINDGSGWQNIHTLFGPQQFSTSAAWIEQILDLSSYKDDTIRLRFISIGDNLYSTSAGGIDDISIYNNPSCLPPSDLEALSVGSTEAALKWTTGGANDWIVKHKPDGGNFQFQTTAINDSFALSGLSPGTRYEIWVRDSCGADVSIWHGPLFIITDCYPVGVPFYESFDGLSWQTASSTSNAGTIDNCWQRSDSLKKVWLPETGISSSSISGPANSRSGTGNYMMAEVLSAPGSNASPNELSSPLIHISGLQQPELNFWYHLYGPQIQKLLVYAEQSDDSRILLDSLVGQQQSSKTALWLQKTISLSAFKGDTLKIVFVAKTGNGPGKINMALDDVEIVDGLCNDPLSLSASNITLSSATLNWSSGSAHSNIEYGLAGFGLGSGTSIFAVSSGHVLNGLQPFTTYEFYVQDSCRNSLSGWTGPFSFTTACSAPIANFNHQGANLNLSFDASSSQGFGLNYNWDFGDGNSGSGLNPNHTYSSAGFYNVQLISVDTCGISDTIIKNIQVCEAPQAIIHYTRSGLQVSFDGFASSGASQYYWDLGPGGIALGDSVSATFPAKGNYTVMLVVTNDCGARDTTILRILICDKPTASFTTNISTFNNILVVNFDGTASTFADSFVWDFGDGTKDSTSLTPTHVYPTNNLNYVVSLITTADCGLSDTLAHPLSGPIGLNENSASLVSVFPNPADNRIEVICKDRDLEGKDFVWQDASGKTYAVPLLSAETGHFIFDVSHLAAGEYLLGWSSAKSGVVKITIL